MCAFTARWLAAIATVATMPFAAMQLYSYEASGNPFIMHRFVNTLVPASNSTFKIVPVSVLQMPLRISVLLILEGCISFSLFIFAALYKEQADRMCKSAGFDIVRWVAHSVSTPILWVAVATLCGLCDQSSAILLGFLVLLSLMIPAFADWYILTNPDRSCARFVFFVPCCLAVTAAAVVTGVTLHETEAYLPVDPAARAMIALMAGAHLVACTLIGRVFSSQTLGSTVAVVAHAGAVACIRIVISTIRT